ncbi:MAG: transcription elongation factor GreA, partial [Actinomycetes bacterium]|nr:transcription elongation factor GreA [Actinomycetes bacterium]
MTTETILTEPGREGLAGELHHLETVRRIEVSERIKEAKSFGDLSENSEYDDAKNEQGWIESRIAELHHVLDNAEVVKPPKRPTTVLVGTHVALKVKRTGKKMEYDLVGSYEADATSGRISNES